VKENPHHLFVPHVPSKVEELLEQDIPLTQLQVTLFDDASLVGLAIPHILCDGYGVKAVVQALTQIINGGAPPPPLSLVDPFQPYANVSKPLEAPPHWRVLSAIQTALLVVFSLWRWVWERPIENRDVFFPKDAVAKIKEEAMSDIRKEHGESSDLWVSSSDALLAFCLKVRGSRTAMLSTVLTVNLQCTNPATKSRTPLNVFYTANLRKLLTNEIPASFIQNAVCMVITPTLPLSALSDLSLGALALLIRRTLEAQTTPTAVDRWLKWHIGTAGSTRIFFEPHGAFYVVTNWRDMGLMRVDFSGALPDDSQSGTVKCVYMWGDGIQPIPLRNWIGLWADDTNGGVWTSAFLPKSIWENPAGFGKFIQHK
jgi:hypothetical protein